MFQTSIFVHKNDIQVQKPLLVIYYMSNYFIVNNLVKVWYVSEVKK